MTQSEDRIAELEYALSLVKRSMMEVVAEVLHKIRSPELLATLRANIDLIDHVLKGVP